MRYIHALILLATSLPLAAQVTGDDRSPVNLPPPEPQAAVQPAPDTIEREIISTPRRRSGEEEARDGAALARAVMEASGGTKAWNDRSWNLAFEFVSVRDGKEVARFRHWWNRATNEAVVSGADWEVRFSDIFARRGTATRGGRAVTDTTLTRLLENAYARFINDSYWLLMPLKLLDEGVRHRRLADTTIDGTRRQVLQLSFGNVGLTPGDQYWLYIDPRTKRVVRWRYLLQSGRQAEFHWEGYRRFGPITLPTVRRSVDGAFQIRFDNIRAEGG